MRILQFTYDPVIERTVILKLQGTDRMCHAFDCIFDRMCKIIHRIDAPFISGIMVCHMCHTVNDRITHIDIRRCHINLCTQYLFSVCIFAILHCFKQLQIFFDATVTVRAFFSRFCQCPSVLANLLRCQVTDIGFAFFDQLHCCFIHLVKVIRCEKQSVFPVSTQPFDIRLDGLYKLNSLLGRVGVIKTHVKLAVIFLCKSII